MLDNEMLRNRTLNTVTKKHKLKTGANNQGTRGAGADGKCNSSVQKDTIWHLHDIYAIDSFSSTPYFYSFSATLYLALLVNTKKKSTQFCCVQIKKPNHHGLK